MVAPYLLPAKTAAALFPLLALLLFLPTAVILYRRHRVMSRGRALSHLREGTVPPIGDSGLDQGLQQLGGGMGLAVLTSALSTAGGLESERTTRRPHR
ncbi:hypothetical protein [Streptomyces sp. NPDC101249]|uniref:hypothetical protein n=1 Tax=Streptomyces sp. NPDC101249 TaxID=3366140 RepID=UPI0037FA5EDF